MVEMLRQKAPTAFANSVADFPAQIRRDRVFWVSVAGTINLAAG
jgi:hypothetical protein